MKKLYVFTLALITISNANSQTCNNVNAEFCSLNEGSITYFNFTGSNSGSTTYHWDFGDGTTSNLRDPSHTYITPGTFSACLTMTCVITTSTGGGGYGGGGSSSTFTCFSSICHNVTISHLGCTDSTSTNFKPIATIDDGSCTNCIFGCADILASNYNPLATCNDNSCLDLDKKYFW